MLMTLGQVHAWLRGSALAGDPNTPILRVHTDTRSLQPGDLFVALRGEQFDAHDFLSQAKAAGAAAAIAERGLAQAGLPGIQVGDSRVALGALSNAWRKQFSLPLIAVTGSNGKTTLTQMIASILTAWKPGAVLATQGNFNNDIGLPLTLLRLERNHEVAVVEIGMNHPGEIATLAAIAQPTVAVVNNAQREHLEFMASVEAVADENGSVLSCLPEDGTAVFPAGDAFTPKWRALAGSRKVITFALQGQADADVAGAAEWTADGWQVDVASCFGRLHYRLAIAGLHNVMNSLAAVACAGAAGAPGWAIQAGLGAFKPVSGRSRAEQLLLNGRSITLIDDSYNANPDSVRAAIDLLATLPGPRLLVLGDMGEVGDQGLAFHAEAGAYAREKNIDKLLTLGDLSAQSAISFGAVRHCEDIAAINTAVLAALPQMASVLVKGSRFMRMERVVQAITQHVHASEKEAPHVA
jgi:UDP-N-acetylmuramoyl-tripeptide--D-alanyl-D-alanine ligase